MNQYAAKPHITLRGGQTVVEYRVPSVKAAQTLMPVQSYSSFLSLIREPFAGAWQRNMEQAAPRTTLAFQAVFSCVSLIGGDISKIDVFLRQRQDDGTWQIIDNGSPFLFVLGTPNDYQTWPQFAENWIQSKLLHGNTYVLKERDNRGGANEGVVRAMYVLDPASVTPLVSDGGEVFYRLGRDDLAGIDNDAGIVLPASEVIHDRMNCLWHPLVGVSPLFAAGATAMQGLAIQGNSSKFFENMSRPSGLLTAPGKINDDTAKRLKELWEKNFQGGNIGRLAVMGDGLDYKPLVIPPVDAQLIEQLGWTERAVCAPFHVPPYKIGLQTNVTFSNAAQLNQDYFAQCLQRHIKAFETCLGKGLELPSYYDIEFDTEELMRMDPSAMADVDSKLIHAALLAPNEGRRKRNLRRVEGGDDCYLQQQNFSLPALAKRDAKEDPFAKEPAPFGARDVADEVAAKLMPILSERKIDVTMNLPADPIAQMQAEISARLAEIGGSVAAVKEGAELSRQTFAATQGYGEAFENVQRELRRLSEIDSKPQDTETKALADALIARFVREMAVE
jgi:HK97 family phage portal protein